MSADDDLRAVLVDLCAQHDGDIAVAFRVVQLSDLQIRVVGIVAHGPPPFVQLAGRLEGTSYNHLDATITNLPPLNRWDVRSRDKLASSWVGGNVWDVLRIGSQLGMLVATEGRVWGWIGTLRWNSRAPYGDEDALLAAPSARKLVRRIADIQAGEPKPPARNGSVVVQSGRVMFGDASWPADEPHLVRFSERLGEPRAGVERFGYVDGAVFTATGLGGAGGVAWLVRCEAAGRIEATPMLGLSPKQRQVAEMAARGATIAEIARAVGATENTVKTHLRRAYDACGVATRAELLELVNASVPREH